MLTDSYMNYTFHFSEINSQECNFLDCISCMFSFMRSCQTIFQNCYFTFPAVTRVWPIFSTSSSAFDIATFYILASLIGVWWYVIVPLFCISLMADDAEHLHMCLLVICTSSLVKCLFISLIHFILKLYLTVSLKVFYIFYIVTISL